MKNPTVSVILTHHLDENTPYLNICVESLLRSEGVSFEVIVLSDAETKPHVPNGVQLIWDRSLNTATKKVEVGVKIADPNSKYFLLLSDDVAVSRFMMKTLVEGVADHPVICNPMSNSDNTGQFVANLPWGCTADLKEFNGMADFEMKIRYIGAEHSLMVTRPWIAFYCTLIPRWVWNLVGGLDGRFETRHNDQDYCYRAASHGIASAINFGAFALHFGSKTISKSASKEEQTEATRVFIEKWNVS